MASAIVGIGAFGIGILFALGIDWLIWTLWCWAIPQIWPTGPENLIHPGFLLFVAITLLVSYVGRMLFGQKGD